MVREGVPGGRLLVAAAAAILLLSTGGASGIFQEDGAIAGHTGYVSAVFPAAGPNIADPAPVEYGLATLQETYLFGLIVRHRPLDESAGRLVFVWAADTPDPRADPTLALTGEWARIRDETGRFWTVHEFHYEAGQGSAAPGFFAYAVPVGDVYERSDGTRYNHVLTYRPERLVAHALPAGAGGYALEIPLARGVAPVPETLSDLPPAGVTWDTLTAAR